MPPSTCRRILAKMPISAIKGSLILNYIRKNKEILQTKSGPHSCLRGQKPVIIAVYTDFLEIIQKNKILSLHYVSVFLKIVQNRRLFCRRISKK